MCDAIDESGFRRRASRVDVVVKDGKTDTSRKTKSLRLFASINNKRFYRGAAAKIPAGVARHDSSRSVSSPDSASEMRATRRAFVAARAT